MSAAPESKRNWLDGGREGGRREDGSGGKNDAIMHGADGNNVGEVEKSHP